MVRRTIRQLLASGRTIRVRLTLWYVALLAAILVVFSGFLYLSLSRSLRAEADQTLSAATQQVVSSLDIESGQPRLGEQPPAGALAALFSPGGQLIASSDAQTPLPPLSSSFTRALQGQASYRTVRLGGSQDWRLLTRPVMENGKVVGLLEVARSEVDIERSLRQLLTLMGLAVPLTLLLAVGVGLFLARRALGPIARITREANEIGAEDLSRRLGMPPTEDEVGRLAATFDGMLARLEGAFERQRRFTADASHELRTPLAMLISEADVALARPRKPDEYRHSLESLRADAARMNRLLNELLTLARADAGREVLASEPLSLDLLAGDVLDSMAALADANGVRLERSLQETVNVLADQTRLTQLVVNLVDNGLKYTPGGGTVSVTVRRSGRWAELRVSDTGVGIPEEHLAHIFERFYRADPSRTGSAGSAGLGLSIAEWIVKAHGGEITITSRVGAGTTVLVALPLAAGDADGAAPRPSSGDGPSA